MTYLIRAAFFALSLATITPVANAAVRLDPPVTPTHEDWANG